MILAALVVGGLTAYFYGLRAGGWAAGLAFGALLLGAMVPGGTSWSYAAVGAGVIGVCWLGPRRADPTHAARAGKILRRGVATARAWLRR